MCGHLDCSVVAPPSENDMNTTSHDNLLSWPSVRERLGLSRATCYRLQRKTGAGSFPRPIRLSPRRVAWRESDITAWIEAQARGHQA